MVLPYGFGVGDFVAVGTLAWNVYKSCRAAPGSFSNISTEVLSLHAVLKEADETISRSPLSPESQARLKTVVDGCQCVLGDLQALVDKYERLGTQSKRTWDRMKWGAEDVGEIRTRLISNATMLTAFISTSQTSVEQKLDKLISDFQQGKRTPSVVSLQTLDSLGPDDKEAWRIIRKELEDIGISVAAFDANKDFIFEWFSNAVDTGAFQEQVVSSPSGSVHSLDVQSSTSSLPSLGVLESNKTVTSDTKSLKASKAKTKPTGNHTIIRAEQASTGTSVAAEPHPRVIPTRLPRVAALIANLSLPKSRLAIAVQRGDVNGTKKILTNPATSRLIDRPALNAALQGASWETSKETYALLIDAGADINEGDGIFRPLTKAVSSGKKDIVAFLLAKGADVNYQSEEGDDYSSALRIAIACGDEAMITLLSQRGADIDAVQQVSYVKQLSKYPTGLHQATAKSSAFVVDLLIKLGANLDYFHSEFGTPLMLAVYKGRLETAELLIERGADIRGAPVSFGNDNTLFRSTIHIAIGVSSPDLVRLLLNNGIVTDWHDAYDFAEQRRNLTLSIFGDGGIRDEPRRLLEEAKERERAATTVLKLIKEKKRQESIVRN